MLAVLSKILLFNLLFIYTSKAQQYTLRGQVLDIETELPLSYTSIQIKNKIIGSIADENGYFSIKNPLINYTDSLVFSLIGYEIYTISIKDVTRKNNIKVLLSKKTHDLTEISLSSSYKLTDLIQEAVDSIPQNYYEDHTLYLLGFYTELQHSQSRKKPSKEVEAYISVRRPPIKKQELAEVIVEKVRKELRNMDVVEIMEKSFYLDDIDKDLLVAYLKKKNFKYFDYTLLGIEKCNGYDCYAIQIDRKQKGSKTELTKCWIDTTSLAFVKFYGRVNYEFGNISEHGNHIYKMQRIDLHKELESNYEKMENGKWKKSSSKLYIKSYDKIFKDTMYIHLNYTIQGVISSKQYAEPEGFYLGWKQVIDTKAMLWDDPRWLEERKKIKLKK